MSQESTFMKPLEIKIELMRRGVSQTEIGKACDTSGTMVGRVIYGNVKYKMFGKSKLIINELSRVLEKPANEIFDLSGE